jgi:hypothetical protein
VLIVFQSAVAPAASTSVIFRAGWLALRRSTALVIRDRLSLVVIVRWRSEYRGIQEGETRLLLSYHGREIGGLAHSVFVAYCVVVRETSEYERGVSCPTVKRGSECSVERLHCILDNGIGSRIFQRAELGTCDASVLCQVW